MSQKPFKIEGLGSEGRCTYFFKCTDGDIYVRCGCFFGNMGSFLAKVAETHGNTKYAEGYRKAAELVMWYWTLKKDSQDAETSQEGTKNNNSCSL